ncbi:SAC3 domain-containing protein 1 [Ochlerotatus camptorhynchus]|uniref:SAC3 domain-containing protein 1 n=1 Tax=Ochlerotatus camptorhynchus TaxID=644619 RepID=UPI0031CF6ED3
MESFIRGSCETMCPKSEIEMRTRERMLHFYELKPGSRTEPIERLVVKEFARSAAGVKRPKHWEIRTVKALIRTVEYLLTEILKDDRRPYAFRYEFIFDRLRAVRQEVVMQNLAAEETLDIVEPIVCFLAYSAYHLCESHISEFDPKICTSHLQECLKKVLRCYDDLDEETKSYDLNRRIRMEALYLSFNLGSSEALSRGINLPKEVRKNLNPHITLNIEYLRHNFHRVLQTLQQLSPLEAALAALRLPEIRRQLLLRFSSAFQSKVLTVPLEWIGHVLLYQRPEQPALIEDCQHYNLQVESDDKSTEAPSPKTKDAWWDDDEGDSTASSELSGWSVKFEKVRFDSSKPTVQPRRVEFVDRKLSAVPSISDMLLTGKC